MRFLRKLGSITACYRSRVESDSTTTAPVLYIKVRFNYSGVGIALHSLEYYSSHIYVFLEQAGCIEGTYS